MVKVRDFLDSIYVQENTCYMGASHGPNGPQNHKGSGSDLKCSFVTPEAYANTFFGDIL